jgi:hypothetical protein
MESRNDDVARRAYDLFLARGAQHGDDVGDWLEAERQLLGETTPPTPSRTLTSVPRASKTAASRKKTR